MTPRGTSRSPVDGRALRLGAAATGLFAGAVVGVLAWWALVHFGRAAHALPAFAFGGAASGLATGALFPDVGLALAEATLHLLVGLATSNVTVDDEPPNQSPERRLPWLAAASTFGVLYGFVLGFFA